MFTRVRLFMMTLISAVALMSAAQTAAADPIGSTGIDPVAIATATAAQTTDQASAATAPAASAATAVASGHPEQVDPGAVTDDTLAAVPDTPEDVEFGFGPTKTLIDFHIPNPISAVINKAKAIAYRVAHEAGQHSAACYSAVSFFQMHPSLGNALAVLAHCNL